MWCNTKIALQRTNTLGHLRWNQLARYHIYTSVPSITNESTEKHTYHIISSSSIVLRGVRVCLKALHTHPILGYANIRTLLLISTRAAKYGSLTVQRSAVSFTLNYYIPPTMEKFLQNQTPLFGESQA